MKPNFTAIAALALTLWAEHALADDWWGRDKALHFGVSVALAGGGYAASAPWLDPPWQRAVAGASLSLVLGAGKELHDATGAGDASFKDFTWDVAGTAVGVGLALAVDALVRRGGEHDDEAAPDRHAVLIRW